VNTTSQHNTFLSPERTSHSLFSHTNVLRETEISHSVLTYYSTIQHLNPYIKTRERDEVRQSAHFISNCLIHTTHHEIADHRLVLVRNNNLLTVSRYCNTLFFYSSGESCDTGTIYNKLNMQSTHANSLFLLFIWEKTKFMKYSIQLTLITQDENSSRSSYYPHIC
jgi:hypothetical protein